MNIFYVDECPIKAGKVLADKHIVKMPLESAQMLSTAHHLTSKNKELNTVALFSNIRSTENLYKYRV